MTDPKKTKALVRRNRWGLALLGVGLLAMIGDLAGSFAIKGLGAITCVAPFPKVFSEMDGVEGFAAEFEMHVERANGEREIIPISPELYARLKGPYNRRNVYGAALAGGPFLPEELWHPVYQHGLEPGGPLHDEFDLPEDTEQVRVFIRTKTRNRDDSWTFAP